MLNRIKNVVKYNRFIYSSYKFWGSIFFRFISLFVKTDDKLILYVVYGGQRYDDSPRFLYEYLISQKDKSYSEFKHVWAFTDPDKMKDLGIPVDTFVKIDSFKYFITALKAKYWITNSSASRGLNFKKSNTVNIMFQHGTAGIKKLASDINAGNKSFGKGFKEKFDYIFIQGKMEEPILRRAWNINDDSLINLGLPRNDELINPDKEKIQRLKTELKIPSDKKVILYAPTFREYSKDSSLAPFLKPPFDFDKWNNELGDKYVLLLTAHYEVAKLLDIPVNNPFVINAFKYPYINDLMIVSDMLITDYSSIVFDYSIMGKPILSYSYDYDLYKNERGIYDGYEDLFYHGVIKDENDLIDYIKSFNDEIYKEECKHSQIIRDNYISNYGNAASRAAKFIFG